MKNAIKLFGIIALVAVIGFSMVACDNGSTGGGSTSFSNTSWGDEFVTINFNKSNGVSWVMMEAEMVRGTYTVSGNTITCTITWIASGVGDAFGIKVGDKEILTVSADGQTLTDGEGESYTKKK